MICFDQKLTREGSSLILLPCGIWWGLLGILMGTLIINLSFEKNIPSMETLLEHVFCWTVPSSKAAGSLLFQVFQILNEGRPTSSSYGVKLDLLVTISYPFPLQRINLLTPLGAALQISEDGFYDFRMHFLPCSRNTPKFFKSSTYEPWPSSHPALVCPCLFKLFSADLNNIFQLWNYPLTFCEISLSFGFLICWVWQWGRLLALIKPLLGLTFYKSQVWRPERTGNILSASQPLPPGWHPILFMQPKASETFLKIGHQLHSTTVNSSLWVKWKGNGEGGNRKVGFNEVFNQQLLEV